MIGDGDADGGEHPGEAARRGEIAARVEQDRVAERPVDQRGGVERQHGHPVREQAEGGQHLGGRLLARGGQEDQIHPGPPLGGRQSRCHHPPATLPGRMFPSGFGTRRRALPESR